MGSKRTPLFAAALAAVLVSVLPTAASGAPSSSTDTCVAAALEREAQLWTCGGGKLTYLAPADEETAPEGRVQPTESTLSEATQALAPDGFVWKTEVIVADRTSPSRLSGPTVTPFGNGDEWDTWCEVGTSCSRNLSTYINDKKGNYTYGNQNGAVGTFDIALRTNLNGGQPRYTIGINTDTGPNITLTSTVNCVWDKAFDGTCGHFPVGTV